MKSIVNFLNEAKQSFRIFNEDKHSFRIKSHLTKSNEIIENPTLSDLEKYTSEKKYIKLVAGKCTWYLNYQQYELGVVNVRVPFGTWEIEIMQDDSNYNDGVTMDLMTDYWGFKGENIKRIYFVPNDNYKFDDARYYYAKGKRFKAETIELVDDETIIIHLKVK